MAFKVLSIEIGHGLTKVVEMDYKTKNGRVYNCFSFETPKDMLNDGEVVKTEMFHSLLKRECGIRNINTEKVVFTIFSSRIANRRATIPLVKENRILDVIKANAEEYFPVDLSQYDLAYSIVDTVEEEDGKKLRLSLLAAPKDLIASYFSLATECNLEIVSIDYMGNSTYQAVKNAYAEKVNVIIKVEEKSSLITILDYGKVELQRPIPYGVEAAIRVVMDSDAYGECLTYQEAIEVLCGKSCIRKQLDAATNYKDEEEVSDIIAKARENITESLRYLIGNIYRVIDYYISKNPNTSFDSISLIGLGADFSGLSKLMTNELGYRVKVLQHIEGATFSKDSENNSIKINRYAACIGAGIDPVDLVPESMKINKGKSSSIKGLAGNLHKGKLALIICGALSAILIIYSVASLTMANMRHNGLEKRLAELKPIEDIYSNYNSSKKLYEDIRNMYFTTVTPNEGLVAFIEELENKLPSEIIVLSLNASKETVNLNVNVKSKEAAAMVILQLRTFESLADVSVTGITEEKTELGATVVSFGINCTYAPLAMEAADEATGN